jgi:phospholipid/cholesterol/gamma-HCH transport system ATP-binding protein
MTTPDAAVSVRTVHKAFHRKKVLQGISLEVRFGETIVVLGGSGSGKSVLLKHVNGLLQPDAGEVEALGCLVSHLRDDKLVELRRRVSYIFQNGALFDSLTVGENVAFSLVEGGAPDAAAIAARVAELLTRVGLPGSEDLWPADLSGGMRKRVAIARGLALQPDVILYDEPTAGLDPLTGLAITRLIREVTDETGATSMVVTHDLTLARELGGRIAFLDEGRFDYVGDLQTAAASPGVMGQFVRAGGIHVGA